MPERSKRHHFVPQLVLRGFADHDDQLSVFDRDAAKVYRQAVERAAAENDYNSLRLDDWSLTDAAERMINELIEGPAAEALKRIRSGRWMKNELELEALARYLVFQFLRVPATREALNGLADQTLKLDMATKGPAGMRDVLRNEFGREPTEEEVADHWDAVRDFNDWALVMPREHHVQESIKMAEEFTPVIAHGYSWSIMAWERRHLLTTDFPLLLVPPLGQESTPVGLYTAGTIYFAISRSLALVLVNRAVGDATPGRILLGSFAGARMINLATATSSRRWVYHHPDDDLDDLLGPGWSLPPDAPLLVDDPGARELFERLKVMGEWAYEHPDEPHPFIGSPSFDYPWMNVERHTDNP